MWRDRGCKRFWFGGCAALSLPSRSERADLRLNSGEKLVERFLKAGDSVDEELLGHLAHRDSDPVELLEQTLGGSNARIDRSLHVAVIAECLDRPGGHRI